MMIDQQPLRHYFARPSFMMMGFVLAIGQASPCASSTVTSYTYDAQGQVRRSSNTGPSSSTYETSIDYDAAGNRYLYTVQGSGASYTILTDNILNVLTAHTSTYACVNYGIISFGLAMRQCYIQFSVNEDMPVVFEDVNGYQFKAIGYRTIGRYQLEVQTGLYGSIG